MPDVPPDAVPPDVQSLVISIGNLAASIGAIDERLHRIEAVFGPQPGEFPSGDPAPTQVVDDELTAIRAVAGAATDVTFTPGFPDGPMPLLRKEFITMPSWPNDGGPDPEVPPTELEVMRDSIANDWRSIVAQPKASEQLLIALMAPLRVVLDPDLDDTEARALIAHLVNEFADVSVRPS